MTKTATDFRACLCLLLLTSCAGKLREGQRLSNPSNTVDAVTAVRDPVATVAVPTFIDLVPHGADMTEKTSTVFDADHVNGLQMEWVTDGELLIQAKSARIHDILPGCTVAGKEVKIKLNIQHFEPLDIKLAESPSKKLQAWWFTRGTNYPRQVISEVFVCPENAGPVSVPEVTLTDPVLTAQEVTSLDLTWDTDHALRITVKGSSIELLKPSVKLETAPGQFKTISITRQND